MKFLSIFLALVLCCACGTSQLNPQARAAAQPKAAFGDWNITVHQTGLPNKTYTVRMFAMDCSLGIPGRPDVFVSGQQPEYCGQTKTQDWAVAWFPDYQNTFVLFFSTTITNRPAVFYSGGQVTGKTFVGTWQCYPTTNCLGTTGTITGKKLQ